MEGDEFISPLVAASVLGTVMNVRDQRSAWLVQQDWVPALRQWMLPLWDGRILCAHQIEENDMQNKARSKAARYSEGRTY